MKGAGDRKKKDSASNQSLFYFYLLSLFHKYVDSDVRRRQRQFWDLTMVRARTGLYGLDSLLGQFDLGENGLSKIRAGLV